MLLRVVAQNLKPVTLFQPTTPNISFVPWLPKRSATMLDPFAQLALPTLLGPPMLITHGFSKTYGLYSSHGALQEPNLLGVVAFVCTPLPTRTQRLPTLLRQQCWELLRPFARSLKPRANGRNIVGQQLPTLLDVTCCIRLHTLLHLVGCCCVLLRKVWNRWNF